MKQEFVQVKVSISKPTYDYLVKIAQLYNWSLSETIRKYIEKNLSLDNLK